jgi:hypothetical protein
MKTISFLFLVCFVCSAAAAQTGTWTAFYNSDSTLTGYKDQSGMVKIEPKFSGLGSAYRFDHIIAVAEENNGKWQSYYLTKAGKITGRDSLFIFDNTPDCESEGFIRFHDRKTDRMGLFNRNGDIVIPTGYNAMTRVMNGMLVVLKDAEKKYWDTTGHSDCNHYSWVGGKEMLLDTLGNVLAEDFRLADNLNFFSAKKTAQPDADTTRTNFRAKGGGYLSFTNFEKEFRTWLSSELFPGLTAEKLIAASCDSITWWSTDEWVRTNKTAFVNNNFELLKNGLLEIQQPGADYFIGNDGLNQFMYEGREFENYYNNCGESKQWIYPVMNIVVSHSDLTQNNFSFLRTEKGYRLIEVTLRSGKLRN